MTSSLFCVMKAQLEERQRNYLHLLATEEQNLISNTAETDCPICFSPLQPGEGVVLRECLHTFCRSGAVHDPVAQWFAYSDSFFKSLQCHMSWSAKCAEVSIWCIYTFGFFLLCMCVLVQGVSKGDSSEQSRCGGVLSRQLWEQATGPRDQSSECVRPENKKLTRV